MSKQNAQWTDEQYTDLIKYVFSTDKGALLLDCLKFYFVNVPLFSTDSSLMAANCAKCDLITEIERRLKTPKKDDTVAVETDFDLN